MSASQSNSLLRQWHGPLTRDLVLRPGDFGLGQVPARLKPDSTTTSVCGFCSTGCGLNIHLKDGEAINLTADTHYPVNLGMACPKGWEALTPLSASDRGTTPLLRNSNGDWQQVDWHAAMHEFCARMKGIQARHGPHSIAFLGTGQICTEEMALLGCLFKFGMGGLHCDSNTRQCMATSHTAYKESFGFDAPPFAYSDLEQSDVLVFMGANPCIAHPILWQRVMRNRRNPQIVVLDPRKTETAMAATQHYPLRPKSDLALLYGLANLLIVKGWVNREFVAQHTTGFEAFVEFVAPFTVEKTSEATGMSQSEIHKLANTIRAGERVSFWWTMGVNQGHEATRTAQAIINLALMSGNIGRPGTGANSITGQCNAMGSRLFANITSLIGGHDSANPVHRAKVSAALGIPEARIPNSPSWAYDQILDGIREGKIKGLWVIATDVSHSWPDQDALKEILGKLEFLVVQDMYPTTETARHAHLYLPAAGWGEKEGTFINSERRMGLVKKVRRAPGKALSDFNIFKLIAEYWGCGDMFQRWSSPETVFGLLRAVSRDQPCDITGIQDYRMLDECGGIQWPWTEADAQQSRDREGATQERRLFEDGRFFRPDGRALFVFEHPKELPEKPDHEYPFLLLTGRGSSAQWHTGSRTSKSDVLRKLAPTNCYMEINPMDAARLKLQTNRKALVRSRRGSLTATVLVTATVQPGQVFVPMHYATTNRLTLSVFDPYSRQPAYKSCAVRIERVA